jgi:N4-gp56 family major capsid protein
MAETYMTFSGNSIDAVTYYIEQKLLDVLQRDLVLQKGADKYTLPQKMGKTIRVIRAERIALPNTANGLLIEGVTPPSSSFVLSNIDATVEQWGLYVTLTDVLKLTVKHDMLAIAIDRVAMAMREMFEREDSIPLLAVTNVTYAGDATTRATLDAADVFNTALAITVRAKLRMRGAPPYSPDGMYLGFMQPPHTAAVLGSDQTFQNATAFARENNLKFGYLGPWMGTDWVEGNFLPVFVGVAAPDTNAITATKAKYTVGLNGSLATANFQLKVVAREIATDYERRISVQTGNVAVTSPGSILVQMPSSTAYSYDVYMTQGGGTTAYLVASRRAASSEYLITTAPAGTETVAPSSPASGVSVYPGFVCGKGAYGTVMLNGMALQTFITPEGSSDSDPLAQRRKVGAKVMRKTWVLDPSWIERFETSSALAAAIPA